MRLYFLMLIGLIITSCGDNDKKTKELEGPVIVDEIKKESENQDVFTLKLNAKIKNDDKLTLYYLKDDQKSISGKNSISVSVTGSEYFQDVVFTLNENILPSKLILMYGKELKTQEIVFGGGEMNYGEEVLAFKAKTFFQYFNPNKFIDYNKDTFTAISQEVEGKHTPVFFSRKVLDDRIDLIFY